MRRILIPALVVSFTLFAPVALAISQSDPHDVDGKLDIVRIAYKETSGGGDQFKIKTATAWSCKYLQSSDDTDLQWKFDEKADGDVDYEGDFICRGGNLVFVMQSPDGSQQFEELEAKKPTKRVVKVTIPGGFFKGAHLDVFAKSKDGEAGACSTPCKDRAPDSGKMGAY